MRQRGVAALDSAGSRATRGDAIAQVSQTLWLTPCSVEEQTDSIEPLRHQVCASWSVNEDRHITSAKHVSHERSAGRTLTQSQSPHQSLHPVVTVPQPAATQVAAVSREQSPADALARLDDKDCGGELTRWKWQCVCCGAAHLTAAWSGGWRRQRGRRYLWGEDAS